MEDGPGWGSHGSRTLAGRPLLRPETETALTIWGCSAGLVIRGWSSKTPPQSEPVATTQKHSSHLPEHKTTTCIYSETVVITGQLLLGRPCQPLMAPVVNSRQQRGHAAHLLLHRSKTSAPLHASPSPTSLSGSVTGAWIRQIFGNQHHITNYLISLTQLGYSSPTLHPGGMYSLIPLCVHSVHPQMLVRSWLCHLGRSCRYRGTDPPPPGGPSAGFTATGCFIGTHTNWIFRSRDKRLSLAEGRTCTFTFLIDSVPNTVSGASTDLTLLSSQHPGKWA